MKHIYGVRVVGEFYHPNCACRMWKCPPVSIHSVAAYRGARGQWRRHRIEAQRKEEKS